MPPPVRIKLYGLWLTRRGYLTWLVVGAVLLLGIFSFWALALSGPYPSLQEQAGVSPWVLIWIALRTWMPLILVAAALLEGVEAYFVFRRFRHAEAKAAQGVSTDPTQKGN